MYRTPDAQATSPSKLAYFVGGVLAGALVGGVVGFLAHDLIAASPTDTLGEGETWAPRPVDRGMEPWLDTAQPGAADAGTNVAAPDTTPPPSRAEGEEASAAPERDPWLDLPRDDDPSPSNPSVDDVDPGGVRLDPSSADEFDAPEP